MIWHSSGSHRANSKWLEVVSADPDGTTSRAGWALYLECRATAPEEWAPLAPVIAGGWARDYPQRCDLDLPRLLPSL